MHAHAQMALSRYEIFTRGAASLGTCEQAEEDATGIG